MNRGYGIATVLLAAAVLGSAPAAVPEPGTVEREIDAVRLDATGPVEARGLSLDTGHGTLEIREGLLFPATAVAGRVVEMVFLGSATLAVDPPDEIEASQIELFTGESKLVESVSEAVMVVCLDAAAERLLDQPRAGTVAPAVASRAEELFDGWRSSPERRLLDVRAAIFMDALDDPSYAGYFAGRFRSDRLGDFLLVVDPDDAEQVTLGRFVPLGGGEREHRKRRRYIHRQQRKGRLIGVEVEDLGIWDTWMSARLVDPAGRPYGGVSGFEPEHYRLDVSIGHRGQELTASGAIRLRPTTGDRRVVKLRVSPDLEHVAVRHQGRELFVLREPGDAYAVLPHTPATDETVVVELEFGGALIDKVLSRVYRLRDTMGWYPHVGQRDRATYDVTFHWPRELDLLASGQPVRSGREGRHRRWQRRVLEVPASAFSFELGDFDVRRLIVGHIDVEVGFDKDAARAPKRIEQQVIRTVRSSLRFYEETFGPYPLDHLTVVTAPREFSQGLLSFVTLSSTLMQDPYSAYWLGIEDRRTVIAHEIAHQWWGNLVGWEGYRDEWISEAMAGFSASVWARQRLPRNRQPRAGPADQWQAVLATTLEDGRSVESLGPLVLGRRLSSSRSLEAYESIVYNKGVVVVNMLNHYFGERLFLRLLAEVVRVGGGDPISTRDFLNILAESSRSDLDWFARQYVYRTGLPEVYYSYEFVPHDNGKWRIRGEVRQQTPYRYSYRVVRTPDGGFDIRREALSAMDVSESRLVVPVQIAVYNPGNATWTPRTRRKQGKRTTDKPANSTLVGRLLQRSESFEFELEIEYEPKRFWLDREGTVFGRFFSEHQSPKRTLVYLGFDAAARGDLERAEAAFLEALDADLAPERPDGRSVEAFLYGWEERYLDASIHTNLAWLYMDQGRLENAREEIRLARRTPHNFTRVRIEDSLEVLESRYDILQGRYEQAFRRLRKSLHGGEGTARRTDAWLLLAIAAHALDEHEELERVDRVVRRRGVDLAPLSGADGR